MLTLSYNCIIRDKNFPLTTIFDEFFSFSNERYRVIKTCSFDHKVTYQVEKYSIKSSFILTALKIMGFATGIIPIIMGLGKLIARIQQQFFIEKIVPPNQDKLRQSQTKIANFKKNALKSFESKHLESRSLNFDLNEEQRELLKKVNPKTDFYTYLEGRTILKGALNHVVIFEAIPGFVFKPMKKEDANEYVTIVENARKVVQDNNLYLIHVPESRVIEVNNKCFVMQSKAEILSTDYTFQKGVYESCWQDQAMMNYMEEAFSQLMNFICETKYSDVKYDNLPLTEDGKLALIDLDQRSVIQGLTRGGAKIGGGLFNYLPLSSFAILE